MRVNEEVYQFYQQGAEIGRLERGIAQVEAFCTKELLEELLPEPSTIYDVGGGVGYYADWLAGRGHQVTMVELSPAAVEYAETHRKHPYKALVGDARELLLPAASAEAVLLFGPLYHLLHEEDRLLALGEAFRVLKPGGLLLATAVSAFSTLMWAITTYGRENRDLDHPAYFAMIEGEISTGIHTRPKEFPHIMAQAYFHRPEQLAAEVSKAGFQIRRLVPLEGCARLVPDFEERWAEPASRQKIMDLIRLTEDEPSLMGISSHILCIAQKK